MAASGEQPSAPDVGAESGGSPAVFGLLDQIAESVLVAAPLRDAAGQVTDFSITHLSPGYADPAGRSAAEVGGLTLLQAYPESASGDGLYARAVRVLAGGEAEQVPGVTTAERVTGQPGTGSVADLRAARYAGQVVFTWRRRLLSPEDGHLAELLDHVQRLGQLGGWEEDLRTGAIHWTDAAFAVFGLDPVHASPIPMSELHSYVIAADRALVRRFRQSLLRLREPAAAVFRIARLADGAVRQIRVFAEPVLEGGELTMLRGAFQDVSTLYQTQVALAATRSQLADSEQRAAEEHELAVRLQRAIMPSGMRQETAGMDIAVRYRPAEPGYLVAGDWYDTLTMPDGDVLLVIGDIAGHGIEAVTGMVTSRNALRGLAATGAGPRELLSQLNYAACTYTEGVTGTAICARFRPDTRTLRWARAGHLPPMLIRGGVAAVQPTPEGMLLGMEAEAQYEEVELQLRAGDTLLLYTDGLIERRASSISDALAELAAVAVPAGPDLDTYAARLLASAGSDTGDDACLLAVRIS